MSRILAVLTAGLAASALVLPAPASADFFIKKTKPAATASQPQKRTPRPPRRTRPVENRVEEVVAPPAPVGIDPALMEQAVTESRYTAKLVRDPVARTARIDVTTSGKSGWSVSFHDCTQENQCGSMEFYILWPVSNEANVCTVWGNDVAKDPTGMLGKPVCYVVPSLKKQFHLKLSTAQAPYTGLVRLSPDLAKEQMRGMIATWSNGVAQLRQAWDIAAVKCPKVTDKCGLQPVVNIPPKKTAARN